VAHWPEWLFLAACARLSPPGPPGLRQQWHTKEHYPLAACLKKPLERLFSSSALLAQILLNRGPNDWGFKQFQSDRNPAPFAPHGTSLPRAAFFSAFFLSPNRLALVIMLKKFYSIQSPPF
jgi:hypothetical protein